MVPMTGLKKCLEELGFSNVSTFIASGNVILAAGKPADEVKAQIEQALPGCFKLDSRLIKVLVLTRDQLRALRHKITASSHVSGLSETDATVKASRACKAYR